jgi:hypothetical protein
MKILGTAAAADLLVICNPCCMDWAAFPWARVCLRAYNERRPRCRPVQWSQRPISSGFDNASSEYSRRRRDSTNSCFQACDHRPFYPALRSQQTCALPWIAQVLLWPYAQYYLGCITCKAGGFVYRGGRCRAVVDGLSQRIGGTD